MPDIEIDSLLNDINNVQQIEIIPSLLEVVCRTTGMGFAAVARVTTDRWIACSVRDEIDFGLKPGGELRIETTICNEIRQSGNVVIIDHVANDELYRDHHTPRIYGFQSYISVPIVLKDGEFFGTLCAIDPAPARLNNSHTIALFTMFADLISFHLETIEVLHASKRTINRLNTQATDMMEENRQYQFVSDHNLAEPLRKLCVFSNMLIDATEKEGTPKIRHLAQKINSSAEQFSMMMKDMSKYTSLSDKGLTHERIDLSGVIAGVRTQLTDLIIHKNATVKSERLHEVRGVRFHIEQLFFNLIVNALTFNRANVPPEVIISSHHILGSELNEMLGVDPAIRYLQIDVQDNGRGIEAPELEKIFYIFSKVSHTESVDGYGIGLAYCRKIAKLHGGFISVSSQPGVGSIFSVTLPLA
ncbi:sensor histidine kinase [Parachryseolinea silvisoli]|uniref:sensor histidine kinase n=1 Tax=Parachryseolinea silvisoli TaxID=2873601 RepID=UPI002265A56D|nr:GAF domain-containing sensor histidine kinase [Parachryseolinea silvisoli]MCD9017500.1 GAF domain-containing sensor histidine kinase [Parachryseolinea silvisoli]